MATKKKKKVVCKWFKSTDKKTGWKKTQGMATRREHLLGATNKRQSLYKRYIQAARKIQSLANMTPDSATATKAEADAKYFFKRAKEAKPKKKKG